MPTRAKLRSLQVCHLYNAKAMPTLSQMHRVCLVKSNMLARAEILLPLGFCSNNNTMQAMPKLFTMQSACVVKSIMLTCCETCRVCTIQCTMQSKTKVQHKQSERRANTPYGQSRAVVPEGFCFVECT